LDPLNFVIVIAVDVIVSRDSCYSV
jgi:hypothetical protein